MARPDTACHRGIRETHAGNSQEIDDKRPPYFPECTQLVSYLDQYLANHGALSILNERALYHSKDRQRAYDSVGKSCKVRLRGNMPAATLWVSENKNGGIRCCMTATPGE